MLFRKSNNAAAELSYMGHLLIENRNGLIVDADLTQATGFAERACATNMLGQLPATKQRRTIAADKSYDTKDFVADVRKLVAHYPHLQHGWFMNTPPCPGDSTELRPCLSSSISRLSGVDRGTPHPSVAACEMASIDRGRAAIDR